MGAPGASKAEFAPFRNHLPDLNTPRFTTAKTQDPYEYVDFFRDNQAPPWLYALTKTWEKLLEEPFKGVTTDGNIIPNLFHPQDEGLDIQSIVDAANTLLDLLTPTNKSKLTYPFNAKEWRAWSNPEPLLRPLGLRLEELATPERDAIHAVLRASLSPAGYAKAQAAMRINAFLGQLVALPRIMNENSYNFLLFGTPSADPERPWGWLLYGHHLDLAVVFKGRQIVVSPSFTGAEPNIVDEGPWAGTEILHQEGALGLELMQSLDVGGQERARVYELLRDPSMRQTGDLSTDRWNRDDQRHLCGAFRDNRVVPYEGICVGEFDTQKRSAVRRILEQFLLYWPDKSREMKLRQCEEFYHETWFCWIGGYGDDDAFYYRIQSPVILVEFDHHSGVFLANEEPAKFHTHTIVRTPNGGDYGCGLRQPEEMVQ